ncbi:MAG: hypothetical protein FWF80_02475 [Defluviitaleaceae bacterium]|nr:hypothetical protein [Defluviitaleaceae bacterium]
MMSRSINGYNEEAKKGREAAMKYCQLWQFELTKMSTALSSDYMAKKITQAVYNVKREELNKQTEQLNKCISTMNAALKK